MTTEIVQIKRCRGMTLVELLMVVSIMTILLVVAIPMIRPAFQDRNLREAARMVNAFFAGAKARAAETGRPVGVWIERLDGPSPGTKMARRLYVAEVAPSFSGSILSARAGVSAGQLVFDPNGDNQVLLGLVASDEEIEIRFDHMGKWYRAKRSGNVFQFVDVMPPPPGALGASGVPYQIQLPPRRSIVSPLTLPSDMVIDLSVSGFGNGANARLFAAGAATTPVLIMFLPTGQMGEVYANNIQSMPSDSAYLLIGRAGKVVDPTTPQFLDAATSNLMDATNLWVTISNRTGAVSTADNADTTNFTLPGPPADPIVERIKSAREFARTSIQKGGR
ncbi:MAG: pilus assembly FimT family protein [Pirellulaceae bacterium]